MLYPYVYTEGGRYSVILCGLRHSRPAGGQFRHHFRLGSVWAYQINLKQASLFHPLASVIKKSVIPVNAAVVMA